MVSISLLPQEYKRLNTERRKQARLFIVFGIVFLLLLLLMGIVSISGRAASHQLNSTLAYKQLLEKQLASLSSFEEPYEKLVAIEEIVKQIESEKAEWVPLLYQIGVQTPQGVWLTDFRGTALNSGKVVDIALQGRALSHSQVGRFLEQLKQIPFLSNVKCLFSISDAGQTQFEITATADTGSLTQGDL